MRPSYRFRSFALSIVSAALSCSLSLAAQSAAPTHPADHKTSFRTAAGVLVVVPVQINGAGPFDFIVDTGTTLTLVDQELATKLALQPLEDASTRLTGLAGTSKVPFVRLNSLDFAGQSVSNLRVGVSKSFPAGIRGIVSEDLLSRFDILIDYRHHIIELAGGQAGQPAPSSLAASLEGEQIPVSTQGNFSGSPTPNRLVLQGHASEFGDRQLSLLLDSGTDSFVLFPTFTNGLNAANLRNASFEKPEQTAGGLLVSRVKVQVLHLDGEKKDGKFVPNVTAVLLTSHDRIDVDGTIPATWFHSLFICHTGGYVILNPSITSGR
jgi:predicted aspartyl protease